MDLQGRRRLEEQVQHAFFSYNGPIDGNSSSMRLEMCQITPAMGGPGGGVTHSSGFTIFTLFGPAIQLENPQDTIKYYSKTVVGLQELRLLDKH